MATSRIVGYTAAEPTTYKPGPIARLRHASKKKVQGFVGKNKTKLKEQRERALDNINFALTNQIMYAIWGSIAIALACSPGVRGAIGSFMRGDPGEALEMAKRGANRVSRGGR